MLIDENHTFDKVRFSKEMTLAPHSVLLVEWNAAAKQKSNVVADKGKFGGLE